MLHCKHCSPMLAVARKQTTSWEILLWMTPSEAPKALQTSECSELLDPMRASCWIFAQHQPGKFTSVLVHAKLLFSNKWKGNARNVDCVRQNWTCSSWMNAMCSARHLCSRHTWLRIPSDAQGNARSNKSTTDIFAAMHWNSLEPKFAETWGSRIDASISEHFANTIRRLARYGMGFVMSSAQIATTKQIKCTHTHTHQMEFLQ